MGGDRTCATGQVNRATAGVTEAAEEIARSLPSRLVPDEVSLEFGLGVSAEVNWWFFAKSQGEGTIKVTLKWAGNAASAASATQDIPDPSEV